MRLSVSLLNLINLNDPLVRCNSLAVCEGCSTHCQLMMMWCSLCMPDCLLLASTCNFQLSTPHLSIILAFDLWLTNLLTNIVSTWNHPTWHYFSDLVICMYHYLLFHVSRAQWYAHWQFRRRTNVELKSLLTLELLADQNFDLVASNSENSLRLDSMLLVPLVALTRP